MTDLTPAPTQHVASINDLYLENKSMGLDTIVFLFINPRYVPLLAVVLDTAAQSRQYRTYILFNGPRADFAGEADLVLSLEQKYDCHYSNEPVVSGLMCDYLFTLFPDFAGDNSPSTTIAIPLLSPVALERFADLFTDSFYTDGFPFSNKINHVLATYHDPENALIVKDCTIARPMGQARRFKILFLSQLPNLWQSAETVCSAFNLDPRSIVDIVQLPFYHENYDDSADIGAYLKRRSVPFEYWYHYDLRLEKPDVVFYLSPYDSTRPYSYQFAQVSSLCKRTVYIQYALEVSGGYLIDYNFGQPIHMQAWRIFVRSERYRQMYEKYCPSGSRQVVVTGHPKMDLLYQEGRAPMRLALRLKKCLYRFILWNPHHTTGAHEWSTFLEWYNVLIDITKRNRKLFLIIRPHPMLFKNLRKSPEGEQALQRLDEAIQDCRRIRIDLSESYLDSFNRSDALISDASSLLLEYLPTRKPILYTPKQDGGGLNEDGIELVKHYYVGRTAQEIADFCMMVRSREDPMYQDRITQIPVFLHSFDGKAGLRIKEHVMDSLVGEMRQSIGDDTGTGAN